MAPADEAITIAKLRGASLLFVHVIPSQMRLGPYSSSITTPKISEDTHLANEAVESLLERVKKKALEDGVEVETRVISSGYTVGQVIVDLAEEENAKLIVVGTRGMTGFKKILIGSVALEVVTYGDCSVMVVK
ncbi:MAG TPA: universal stress protein [Nitrososphaeraceae archaeon]|jgi:nucleotide-binding universal stress UspA family protein